MTIKKLAMALGAATLGLWAVSAPASAQNTANSQLLGAGVMQKINASDVMSILAEFEIQTALAPYDGGEVATIIATIEGGGQFFISMYICDNLATASGCGRALFFTGLPNAGLSYDDLNTFNGNAEITVAVNVPAQNIIVCGSPVLVIGGIGRDNFKLHAALFLNDVQNFVNSQSGSASTVSLRVAPKAGGKLDNITGAGADAASDMPLYRASLDALAVSSAIANTWKTQFLTDEAKAALE